MTHAKGDFFAMNYEVTAIRKRPQTFDELVGQEFVVTTLKNALESNRVGNAYLRDNCYLFRVFFAFFPFFS